MILVTENCTDCGSIRVIPTTLPAEVVLLGGPDPGVKMLIPADEGVTPPQHSADGIPPGDYVVDVGSSGRAWTRVAFTVQTGGIAEIRVPELPAVVAQSPECKPPRQLVSGVCQEPAPVAPGTGKSWHWYALGGLLAVGLLGAGLYTAGGGTVDLGDDDTEENPRRKRSRRGKRR